MNRIALDATTLARMPDITRVIEITDSQGRTLGFFHPTAGSPWHSSMSREELEKRRQDRSGRPLRDVINDLKAQ